MGVLRDHANYIFTFKRSGVAGGGVHETTNENSLVVIIADLQLFRFHFDNQVVNAMAVHVRPLHPHFSFASLPTTLTEAPSIRMAVNIADVDSRGTPKWQLE